MKNIFLALLSGVLLAISWPTYGFPLFLFIGFVPLLLAEDRIRNSKQIKSKRKIFGLAYLTFLLFNSCTTWWLYYASPFGMFFAILLYALLMSLVFLSYHLLAKRMPSKLSKIALIALWIGFEKFNLNWEFSWPWLNLGNGFSNHYKWVQWYEYTGVFGGTLWIWIVNMVLYSALVQFLKDKKPKVFLHGILASVGLVIIGISASLYSYHSSTTVGEKTTVLLLQPNIDPYTEKYQISNYTMAMDLIELASEKMDSTVVFVIAPETSLPKPRALKEFKKTTEYAVLSKFTAQYPQSAFVSGITFYERFSSQLPPNKTANYFQGQKDWYNSYNSSFILQSDEQLQIYHKSKLVVGVEHIPYRSLLSPILGNVMIDMGGSVATLTPQEERTVFSNSNIHLAPIICYESVYGAYVGQYIEKGSDFLAILTNDGWWSNSQGHKQHLSLARLRAIETGRNIARAANTGISALINEKGDLLNALPYGSKGSIKGEITRSNRTTYYSQHGDYIYRISMFVLVLILLGSFAKKKQAL
jgi:apolipoprotein N-acyltransferase